MAVLSIWPLGDPPALGRGCSTHCDPRTIIGNSIALGGETDSTGGGGREPDM